MNFVHQKRVDDSFWELFKGASICTNCPSNLWTPLKCTYVGSQRRLILDFRVKIVDPTKTILQSVPIRRAVAHKEEWCFLEYTGPLFSLLDKTNNCTASVNFHHISPFDVYFGFTKQLVRGKQFEETDMWHVDRCQKRNETQESELVQIRPLPMFLLFAFVLILQIDTLG